MQNEVFSGKLNQLIVTHIDQRGAWFETSLGPAFLPASELNELVVPHASLNVFILGRPGKDLRASLRLPLAQVGEFAALRVKKILPQGILFDLGRGYELPVAYDEIPFRPRAGERSLVRVELDAEGQLCGSCRIDDFLEAPRGLKVGQPVALMVWRSTELGIKMIINGRHEGLVYAGELAHAQPGQQLTGYVARLREDGKVDLSLNPGGRAGIDLGRQKLLQALESSGYLPLHDKSSPEEIRRLLGLSKKQFKRAAGTLYKEQRIELTSSGIKLKV
ncbi:MAG: GntR family transcriptional regulator [Deltaproteobacteria bacterium]|nr:GntR family transcriptional regulator [Deltaproteobacteria bacterium]NCP02321.1 GntR family transcriptional regulator [Deltaproteobacteria bacterium]NCP77845.1 GntR family transcriptional regulator [Desulfuromonadales bacterium]